ncbi:unnamed protein product [Ectocarpus sp. CCAP 1310/34]|nr:unnamed protein product [Ectocarpus sp. CCAP 1310/34]
MDHVAPVSAMFTAWPCFTTPTRPTSPTVPHSPGGTATAQNAWSSTESTSLSCSTTCARTASSVAHFSLVWPHPSQRAHHGTKSFSLVVQPIA